MSSVADQIGEAGRLRCGIDELSERFHPGFADENGQRGKQALREEGEEGVGEVREPPLMANAIRVW
jgi:hypothetical protein